MTMATLTDPLSTLILEDVICNESDSSSSQIEGGDEVTQKCIAVEKALEIHVVLQEIFQNLNVPTLTSCRQVNQIWSIISTSILQKRDAFLTTIKNTNSNHHSPNEFLQVLNNSRNFPSTHFQFDEVNLEDDSIKLIFENHGSTIKTLEFKNNCKSGDGPTIQNILHVHAPQVENLILHDFNYKWRDDLKCDLPNIKKFYWKTSTQTVFKILQSCPNLKSLKELDVCYDLGMILDANQTKAIRSLIVNKINFDLLQKYLHLGSSPKILTLNVSNQKKSPQELQQMTSGISNLLTFSKDSLEYLEYGDLCAQFDIKFPIFSDLKTLVLGQRIGKSPERLFPKGINLTFTFPNLKILDCTNMRTNMNQWWGKYLPRHDPYRGQLGSVQTVEISDACTKRWLKILYGQLCPNFVNLVIHCPSRWNSGQLSDLLPIIFKEWGHLRSIELKINGLDSTCLDSTITGISQEMSTLVQKESPISMQNLKELQTFKISLGHYYQGIQDGQVKKIPFSRFSWFHAFQFMPKLSGVVLQFDHGSLWAQEMKTKLDSLASFVASIHKHDPRISQRIKKR